MVYLIRKSLIGLILLLPYFIFGQEDNPYDSKLLDTDRLTVEYKDFGGKGVPLIVVQGAHNYFDQSTSIPWNRFENKAWIEFYSKFTETHHVIAPLKRGFGRTDPQLDGENVQTATEDLLSFMDHLELKQAFFIGRDVSAQNMLDLAENYPERVAGLIFIDPRFVFADIQDQVVKDYRYFSYTESYSASEFNTFNQNLTTSKLYRPQIFNDTTKVINVSALLFYHKVHTGKTLELKRIERFIERVESTDNINWESEYSSQKIADYFNKLSVNKDRMYYIRDYLKDNNPTPRMNSALIRAFDDNLVIFNETRLEVENVREALMNVYLPVTNAFLYMAK
jgi:pimeloyl-ACP methyl ester carboxylesterase